MISSRRPPYSDSGENTLSNMRISFKDEHLETEITDPVRLRKHYGQIRAKRLLQRLEELASARSLEDLRLAPGRCRELHGQAAGCLSLELDHTHFLIFCPSADQPRRSDGGVDWKHVEAVEVARVEKR